MAVLSFVYIVFCMILTTHITILFDLLYRISLLNKVFAHLAPQRWVNTDRSMCSHRVSNSRSFTPEAKAFNVPPRVIVHRCLKVSEMILDHCLSVYRYVSRLSQFINFNYIHLVLSIRSLFRFRYIHSVS